MRLVPIVITTRPAGVDVIVNGEPVDAVTDVRLEAGDNGIPTLTIRQRVGAGIVRGDAVVRITDPDTSSARATVLDFLASIDPEQLRDQVMDSLDGHTVVARTLEVLIDLAAQLPGTG